MPSGRKTLKDEIGVLQRYAELSEPYFAFLKKCLEKGNKADKKWACERLDKAFPKMIPTQVGGIDGKPIEVSWLSPSPTSQDAGQNNSTTPSTAG